MRLRHSDVGVLCAVIAVLVAVAVASCSRSGNRRRTAQPERGDVQQAALKTYVAPGDMDEYYLFYSGGHSGQVFVAGVPSMRHIATIPVFTPYPAPATGSTRRPRRCSAASRGATCTTRRCRETNGDYDGRWLFVNDNANNRIARIDLRDFKTKQILGPIPNLSGSTAARSSPRTPSTCSAASRFSVPIPKGTYADVERLQDAVQRRRRWP